MATFNIFKKKKGIYWTNTLIVYSILVPCLILFLMKKEIGLEENNIDAILICLIIGSFAYGCIMKLSGLARYEPLKGKLDGLLILEMNKISIDNQIYNLEEIKKIEIFNYDYQARFKYTSRGSFEANLSRGVENEIVITLNSNVSEKCFFYQYNRDDMHIAKNQLINYHLKSKIHFLHLIDILGITDYNQIQLFKKEIQWFQEDKLKSEE